MNESEIFLAAAQIDDPRVRTSFVDSLCDQDNGKRERIHRMLERYGVWEGAIDSFAESLPERLAEIRQMDSAAMNALPKAIQYNLLPGEKLSTYEIASRLGVGGMGEVYLARDQRLDRNVAIKILPAEHCDDRNWIDRFRQEAKSASALNHPNILTVYEVGEVNGRHFIASEFIDGQTLRHLISNASLSLKRKIDIAIQMAEALHAAHSARVVHRDIKPENVMVRQDGFVKVLDFGIAKRCYSSEQPEATKTRPGMLFGTTRYMSPEQASGTESDHRSDIFSFGTVLFELFSGKQPFAGSGTIDVLAGVIRCQPIPLRTIAPELPLEIERLVAKMMRKDPDARFQSAREIAIDLKQLLARLEHLDSDEVVPIKGAIKRNDGDPESSTVPANCDTQLETPEVRYALSGQVNIAYQVLGNGEIDLVFVMGWVSHLDWFWKDPSFARFLLRLASFTRLILFDKRGTGLSDRVPQDQLPTLEQRMDDVRAVMDAVGSDKAVLCGVSEGGPMCALFAATYPEKTIALAMIGSYSRRLRTDDYPWGPSPEQHQTFLDDLRKNWGGPVGIDARAPSRASDPEFRAWWSTYLRMGASPGAALALTKMNAQIDVRPVLKTIQVPTIVIHRRGDKCLLFEEGKYLAENIPGAKWVELPGHDHLPFVGNQEEILEPIEEFLTGVTHNQNIKRVLVTVLFAKTASAVSGTETPRVRTAVAHAVRDVELFRGQVFQKSEDSMAATFDGPARAVRSALAIRDSASRLGVVLQLGVHTGECVLSENGVEGPAVDTAKFIAAQAGPHEVLASRTVKDLIAGAEIHFTELERVQPTEELLTIPLFKVDS